MTNSSVAGSPHTTTAQDGILERVEQELGRLRELRPHLAAKIDRADHILTAHLASRPRTQIIRARTGPGGLQVLVRSLSVRGSTKGAVYVVTPGSWTCSCPDYHRSGGICKHAVAAWILSRATVPRVECPPCRGTGTVWIGEAAVDEAGHETERISGQGCSRCGGKGVL